MRNIKYLITIMLSAFVLHSCSNADEEQIGKGSIDGSAAIEFLSIVEGDYNPMVRAIASSWTADDRIGIFMKKEGQDLSAGNIVAGASNIEHTTITENGIFTAVDATESIYFPKDGSKIDFVAYYPFQAEMTNYKYKVDVSEQFNQEAIDLLFSNNVKAAGKDNPQTLLKFNHMLSRITFNLQKGEGVTSLLGMKISIAGQPTLAEFDLVKGTLAIDNQSVNAIEARTYNDGANAEAIVLPVGKKDLEVTFTLGSSSFTHKFKDVDLTSGKKNEYRVTINNKGGSVTPTPDYAMWSETPLFTPKESFQYVSHGLSGSVSTRDANIGARNFSMLYDKENRVALWVAYPLHKGHLGSIKRTDAWEYDPSITEFDQPYLKKSWPSYPTYNRGHQIASSDRTATTKANRMTFYYSNMTLQQVEFNGGTWERLENQVRDWAGAGASDTVYVVTGVILTTPEKPNITRLADNSKPAKMAAVPQYFYKALAKQVNGKYYTIGYRLPNIYPPSGDKFYNHSIPVSELEKETGFTFFPNLDIVDKTTIDNSKWTITVK